MSPSVIIMKKQTGMMFRTFMILLLWAWGGCTSRDDVSQTFPRPDTAEDSVADFKYNILGHPVVEARLDTGHECSLIFDTGGAGMLVLSDSSALEGGLIDRFEPGEEIRSGWNFTRGFPCMTLDRPVTIVIGGSRVTYPECRIVDSRLLNFSSSDGICSLPHDDTRTWELDCVRKRLVIYERPVFSLRGIPMQMDIVKGQFVMRDFPLRFRCGDGYVEPREDLVLDTGSSYSLVWLYVRPDSMMQQALSDRRVRKYECPPKNGILATFYLLDECGLLNHRMWIDHRELLRQWRMTGEREMIVAGMDFLKSFNLRFHPAHRWIELVPIAYTPLMEDLKLQMGAEASDFTAFKSKEGHAVVYFVMEGSKWWKYGLQEGDVILEADGRPLFSLSRTHFDDAVAGVQHSFKVVRDRDTLIFGAFLR